MTEYQTILDLSLLPEHAESHQTDFTDLFGIWSESDFREFSRSVEDFDKIDPEDWH
jgi:hypothetical protein